MNYNKNNSKKTDYDNYGLAKIFFGIPLIISISCLSGYYVDKGLKELNQSQWMTEKRKKFERVETFANSINNHSKMKWINEGIVEVDSDLDSIVDGYIIHIPARPGGIMYIPAKK